MAEEVVIDRSSTSPAQEHQGKECTAGRFLTAEEGKKILEIAETWVGTPYSAIGARSEKGIKGDCSGTTNKIYTEAGHPYPYQRTADFIAFAETTNRFREIDLSRNTLQAGDVLWWPGHMAIYAPFPDNHPRSDTRVSKGGKRKLNNMYTAFNERTGVPYGPYNIETFRPDKYRAFRYFLRPGDAKC